MTAKETDEELMSAYVSGDARAFDTLFARWGERLHAFFARTFRSGPVADDLLQTTFLKVHAARDSYDPTLPVRPWLYGIAARVRADELRRRYRKPSGAEVDLEHLTIDAESADAWPERDEARARVRAAVDGLPEGQRMVVILHRFEGLTFGEIAGVVSEAEGKAVTEGAIRVRAFRAYEVLRGALADLEDAASRAGGRR